ncbi:unnamed protein product [Linum trigynum]|uniref:tRNA(adenine(34)) deaminase n=1 Tax=Linum trigynum TaxID=586398 RepID=A0AAV2GFJ8_9ROSI
MHHTYITSTLLSIGTHHGSISISSNDCSSNLFCERFGGTPFALSSPPPSYSHSSQCCSCCAACCSCCGSPSLSKSSYAIKPSYLLYGLRQSSLIQCPPSRRMSLGGRVRCYNRVQGYGFDLGDYEVPCSFEESSGRGKNGGRRREVRPRQVNSQRRQCLDSASDAKAVIDLLSEEVCEDYLDCRRRIGEFSERLQKVRRGSYGGGECESQRKKNLRLRLLASKSTCEFESNTNEFKKEESRMKEVRNEKKDSREVYRGENSKVRTGSVSLSSYYSLSSEEEFENDKEVHEEELSTGDMNELGESSSQCQVVGAFENHPEDSEKQKEVSEHRTRTSSIEWDLRKKSEKKLTDFEETEYVKHSSQLQSRTESTQEDNRMMKSMNSGTRIDDFSHEYKVSYDKEEIAVVVSQEKRAAARYNQRGNNKAEKQAAVKRNSQQVTGRQDIHETDSGTASRYHRLSPGGEGMVVRGGKDRSSSSQEPLKITEMRNAGLETVSTFQKQSESLTKTQEERKALSSYWEVSDKRDQIGTSKMMGEIESTMSSQKSHQTSEGHQQYRGKTSTQHSESEVKGQRFHRTDQKPLERVQSRKGPKDATNLTVNLTNVSLVNASSNTETVVNSQRNSQQIIVNQGGDNTSTARPIQETGGRRPLLVRGPQGVRKTSSLHKRTSERASSPQTSEEEDAVERMGSEAVLVPPSHQLVARSSFRENPASGVQVQDVSEGEMSVPEIHQEPQYEDLEEGELNDHSLYLHNHGDVLGSARRQEESSMQYVEEFVERARHHEASCETEVSKGNNLRRLSADSGEKGPSEEIWDVTDPSVHEPPKAEAPEELKGTNEAGSSVVTERSEIRKTGKSMWAVIGDIVRLRWSSPRAETSKSTGGKTSSNDTAASEAWFSGRDPDENSEGTLKKDTSSSDQVLLSHTSSQRRGLASDTGETKSMASPSIILKSGSTSRGFASPAGEKDLDISPDGKRSQVAPSSVGVGETPSISLPLSARSSPIVNQSLGSHKSDASASGSGDKDGEAKRRKLQRNKQVIRDRFDDWEEAYIRESEQRKIDEMFMREALVEAKKAADIWEVPVGAVLVQHGKIIARGYNLVEELRDSTAHAEMICIREGSNQLRSWRLAETTLYVTLEPCTMCAGAILQARIDTLVWGAPNKLLGADGSWIRIFPNGGGNGLETDKPAPPVHPFHPKMTIRRGVLAADCADVMQSFFQLRRKKKVTNIKGEQQQQHSPQNSLVRVSNHPSKVLKKMHDIFHIMFCL